MKIKSLEDLCASKGDKSTGVILEKYKVLKTLGKGSFGKIYKVLDTSSHLELALKVEIVIDDCPTLEREQKWLNALAESPGFPKVFFLKRQEKKIVLGMEVLGPSLTRLIKMLESPFTLKTVLMIAGQLLTRVEELHSKGIVHRDIKPDNILIGREDVDMIYLIDFGLAKSFLKENGSHVAPSKGRPFCGTCRFASVNAHKGFEQSRRDDLESLFYTLINLLGSSFPWSGYCRKEDSRIVKSLKEKYSREAICLAAPREFYEFFTYIRSLKFEQAPDYAYLRGLLRKTFLRMGFEYDYEYDWASLNLREILQSPKEMKRNSKKKFTLESFFYKKKSIPSQSSNVIKNSLVSPLLKVPNPSAKKTDPFLVRSTENLGLTLTQKTPKEEEKILTVLEVPKCLNLKEEIKGKRNSKTMFNLSRASSKNFLDPKDSDPFRFSRNLDSLQGESPNGSYPLSLMGFDQVIGDQSGRSVFRSQDGVWMSNGEDSGESDEVGEEGEENRGEEESPSNKYGRLKEMEMRTKTKSDIEWKNLFRTIDNKTE